MMEISKQIIERLKNKDEEAFDIVYYEYVNLIFYICSSMTKDREASKELTQDTFVRMYNSMDGYTDYGKFKQYICQIARNLCKNYLTRYAKNKPTIDEDIVNGVKDEDKGMKVHMFIEDNLDETASEIVILKIVHNFKFKEIAEIMDMSLNNVQNIYYQSIDKLKKEL